MKNLLFLVLVIVNFNLQAQSPIAQHGDTIFTLQNTITPDTIITDTIWLVVWKEDKQITRLIPLKDYQAFLNKRAIAKVNKRKRIKNILRDIFIPPLFREIFKRPKK
jgi:hypothetical protein